MLACPRLRIQKHAGICALHFTHSPDFLWHQLTLPALEGGKCIEYFLLNPYAFHADCHFLRLQIEVTFHTKSGFFSKHTFSCIVYRYRWLIMPRVQERKQVFSVLQRFIFVINFWWTAVIHFRVVSSVIPTHSHLCPGLESRPIYLVFVMDQVARRQNFSRGTSFCSCHYNSSSFS